MFAKSRAAWSTLTKQHPRLTKLARAACFGFVLSESAIAARYYYWLYTEPAWVKEAAETSEKSPLYGKVRFVPGDGQFRPAPFWREEVGTVRYNRYEMPEFVILHECGHSQHPWRVINTFGLMLVQLPLPAVTCIAACFTFMWASLAVSERLADYHALKRCSLEGLKAAYKVFDQASMEEPTISFPPDAHFTTAYRASLIKQRILQLEPKLEDWSSYLVSQFSSPSALKPSDVPLPSFHYAVCGHSVEPSKLFADLSFKWKNFITSKENSS